MTEKALHRDPTARRKAELIRLRARFKYALGAYHLLGFPRRLEHAKVDGLPPLGLKEWADDVLAALRAGALWHEYMLLVTLATSACDDNRTVLQAGTPLENVIYEPNVAVLAERYGMSLACAVELTNAAIDLAVREWIARKPA